MNGRNEQLVILSMNLVNDAYCRDISIKTCTSLEMKQQKGEYVGLLPLMDIDYMKK